jgi:hypothetical protein
METRSVSACGNYKCSVFFPILVSPSLIVHTHHNMYDNQPGIVSRGIVLLHPFRCYIRIQLNASVFFSIVTLNHNCLH